MLVSTVQARSPFYRHIRYIKLKEGRIYHLLVGKKKNATASYKTVFNYIKLV